MEEHQPELDEVKDGVSGVPDEGCPSSVDTAVLANTDCSPWSFSCGNEDAFHGAGGVFLKLSQYGEKHF